MEVATFTPLALVQRVPLTIKTACIVGLDASHLLLLPPGTELPS